MVVVCTGSALQPSLKHLQYPPVMPCPHIQPREVYKDTDLEYVQYHYDAASLVCDSHLMAFSGDKKHVYFSDSFITDLSGIRPEV